jgi:hypothetical protein
MQRENRRQIQGKLWTAIAPEAKSLNSPKNKRDQGERRTLVSQSTKPRFLFHFGPIMEYDAQS